MKFVFNAVIISNTVLRKTFGGDKVLIILRLHTARPIHFYFKVFVIYIIFIYSLIRIKENEMILNYICFVVLF